MKQSLTELMEKAAQVLPPQRPGRSAYRPLLPLLMQMQDDGHSAVSITDFLIAQQEIDPAKRNSAYRSIRNLLARHAGS